MYIHSSVAENINETNREIGECIINNVMYSPHKLFSLFGLNIRFKVW